MMPMTLLLKEIDVLATIPILDFSIYGLRRHKKRPAEQLLVLIRQNY